MLILSLDAFAAWPIVNDYLRELISGRRRDNTEEFIKIPKREKALKTIGRAEGEALNPHEIKVLIWNAQKGSGEEWNKEYQEMSQRKDLILLQELYLNRKAKSALLAQEGYRFDLASTFIVRRMGKNFATGVCTGSWVEPKSVSFQWSEVREPLIRTPKAILFTEYPLEGRAENLLVINVHSINFVRENGFKRQLNKMVEVIQEYVGPILLAGDFNTWSNDRLEFLRDLMEQHEMEEVDFGINDFRSTMFGNIVDYIFLRGIDYRPPHVWNNEETSDHNGMGVVLSVRPTTVIEVKHD